MISMVRVKNVFSFKHANFKVESKKTDFKSKLTHQDTLENVSVKFELDLSN